MFFLLQTIAEHMYTCTSSRHMEGDVAVDASLFLDLKPRQSCGFWSTRPPTIWSGTFFTWPWWSSASWNWWCISQRTSRALWCIWLLDGSQIRVKVLVDDRRNDPFSGDAACRKCTCRDAVHISYISWKSKSFTNPHISELTCVYCICIFCNIVSDDIWCFTYIDNRCVKCKHKE